MWNRWWAFLKSNFNNVILTAIKEEEGLMTTHAWNILNDTCVLRTSSDSVCPMQQPGYMRTIFKFARAQRNFRPSNRSCSSMGDVPNIVLRSQWSPNTSLDLKNKYTIIWQLYFRHTISPNESTNLKSDLTSGQIDKWSHLLSRELGIFSTTTRRTNFIKAIHVNSVDAQHILRPNAVNGRIVHFYWPWFRNSCHEYIWFYFKCTLCVCVCLYIA